MPRSRTHISSFLSGLIGDMSSAVVGDAFQKFCVCVQRDGFQSALSILLATTNPIPTLAAAVVWAGALLIEAKQEQDQDRRLRQHFGDLLSVIRDGQASQQERDERLLDLIETRAYVWAYYGDDLEPDELRAKITALIEPETRSLLESQRLAAEQIDAARESTLQELATLRFDDNYRLRRVEEAVVKLSDKPAAPVRTARERWEILLKLGRSMFAERESRWIERLGLGPSMSEFHIPAVGRLDEHGVAVENLGPRPEVGLTWVTGNVGTGKTAFLRQILRTSLEELAGVVEGGGDAAPISQDVTYPWPMPIFARLTEVIEQRAAADGGHLVPALRRYAMSFVPDSDADVIAALFDEARRGGHLVVLLDGLDEVAEGGPMEECRTMIRAGAEELARDGNAVLLSTRPWAYHGSSPALRTWPVLRTRSFESAEVKVYVHAFFDRAGQPELADEFLSHSGYLQQWGHFATATPLILAASCVLFRDGFGFSESYFDLYDKLTGLLLRKQHRAGLQLRRTYLEIIAEAIVKAPERDFIADSEFSGTTDRLTIDGYTLRDLSDATVDLEVVIDEIATHSGLLERFAGTRRRYSFAHPSFREFFAARHVIERIDDVVTRHWAERDWQGTWSFIASTDRCGELVDALMRTPIGDDEVEEICRSARQLSVNLIQHLWDEHNPLYIAQMSPDAESRLGAVLRGFVERPGTDPSSQIPRLVPESETNALLAIAREILNDDVRRRRDGHPAVDPVVRYVILNWLDHLIAGNHLTKSARDVIGDWLGNRSMELPMCDIPGGELAADEIVDVPSFRMATTTITRGQYAHYHRGRFDNFFDDDHPVDDLNWYESWLVARWFGARLPSENEWEWAARGSEHSQYPWPDNETPNDLRDYASFRGSGAAKPVSVHAYPQRSWCGCVQMAGNVWEWCADFYASSRSARPAAAPRNIMVSPVRVLRGGCFLSGQKALEASVRYAARTRPRRMGLGVRVARSPRPEVSI